jgi:endo-1,4-beta-D-glucanase Y
MTFRVLLPLLALFSATLSGCVEASSEDERTFDDGSAAGAGSKPSRAGSGPISSVEVAGGAAAGASYSNGATGGSSVIGTSPPVTWNSAKSASISEGRLQEEYAIWKTGHVEACANGTLVVVDGGAVRSQGIAYGMLLSVAMADQAVFDGLWKFYQDHLDKNGLMNATMAKCEAPGNNNAGAQADADLDATMALLQAASRWPNATAGYLKKAEGLASKIVQFETDMCDGRRVLRPGDAFGGCSDVEHPSVRPSYFATGYYKVFSRYFPAQASTWLALRDTSYQLFAIYQARMDNLVPDSSRPDGGDDQSQYSYEACRTPWRVAVDYAWTGDTRARTFMQNISSWVDQHGGLPAAAQQQNSAFIGAFALAGGYDQAKFDGYMSGWLGADLLDAPYYQGTLRVLYLLVAAGKFSSTI